MNTITYKGYIGTVSFSERDGVFFGKVEGIDGLVNFEGDSVKQLTSAKIMRFLYHRQITL